MRFAIREATAGDLVEVVALLADDELGALRECFEVPLPQAYLDAFASIDRDVNNHLLVAIADRQVAGVCQLTFLPNLTYCGSWRAQVEGVRVAKSFRGAGLGRKLIDAAIQRAKERNCRLVQLTTDERRPEARRFYEGLGFEATHHGMKLRLE